MVVPRSVTDWCSSPSGALQGSCNDTHSAGLWLWLNSRSVPVPAPAPLALGCASMLGGVYAHTHFPVRRDARSKKLENNGGLPTCRRLAQCTELAVTAAMGRLVPSVGWWREPVLSLFPRV